MYKQWVCALALLSASVALYGATSAPITVYESSVVDGVVVCRGTVADEAASALSKAVATYILNPHANPGGLTLILRGTAQMNAFPAAIAAFRRAASTWESYLTNPITITVDVDFGPTRFGQPYPNDRILGSADSADLRKSYPSVATALQASATRAFEANLYAGLPFGQVPTDRGTVVSVLAPQAALRAIDLLPPSPSPTDASPSIGFNSNFSWDFDRSDGIAAQQFDFESIASHELGHVLGFVSTVGETELSPSLPQEVSVLDLFRVRPGASLATFASELRIQSSGGEQVLFNALGYEPALSTGRPDHTGGDGNQASHWKDDRQTRLYLGAMDPSLGSREIAYATVNDLIAFDILGYRVVYPAAPSDPTDLTAMATSATQIQLTWRDNSSNESEFRLESLINGLWIELGGIPANRTSIALVNLTPNTTYTLALIATNAGGYSNYTNNASATTLSSCLLPSITVHPAPQNVLRSASATLQVVAGGSAPLSYQWYQGASPTGSPITGATSAVFTSPALFTTTPYWVQVSNPCGTANSSTSLVTVIQQTVPNSPQNLTFRDRRETTVTLLWTHDGNNVTSFRTYYSVDGSPFLSIGDMSPSLRSATLTNVQAKFAYSFRLVAVNAAGESQASNVIVVPTFVSSHRRAAARR